MVKLKISVSETRKYHQEENGFSYLKIHMIIAVYNVFCFLN